MNGQYQVGAFRGRKLFQKSNTVGGARSVFVKIQGVKNDLVYPTFGGYIQTLFNVPAKFFAGDLVEYRTNASGLKPQIFILKTFKVVGEVSAATEIHIERTPYRHTPCVGDKIGKAPSKIGGTLTTLTVQSVKEAKNEWVITVDQSTTLSNGDILVESDGSHMLVKAINAVVDADIDMLDAGTKDPEDFDNARYLYTPALGGTMYIEKMSPLPKCVLDLNKTNINGWFKVSF